MGVSVREKKPGEYWVFLTHHGKRTSRKIGKDEGEARDVAEKLKAKMVLGDFGIEQKKDMPTFKEYAEKWLATYVKQVRRLATYDRYSFTLRQYVFSKIGSKPLNLITRGDVRDVLLTAKKKNGEALSRSTIALMKDVCSGVLAHAMDDELISVNPTHGLIKRLQLERDKRSNLDPLNHEEVKLFMEKCSEFYPEHYPFFLCAFRTGMRMGELLALQWGDVDWNGKFIRVERSYKLGRISPTKTGKARRVDMSDQLCETLRGLYTQAKKDGFRMGLGEPVEVVFHRDGAPMEQNYIRRVFKRILQKAELRGIRFHDMRHTYASLLLSDGVTPVYVKEQLGHSSIQMTVDIYGHLIPSSNRGAVNRLDTHSNAHPNAPQVHPPKIKEPQSLEIAALS
jgi:integrase